jgi:hypothetical protein
MRRWKLLVALAGLGALLALAVVTLALRPCWVTKANFLRLSTGMTTWKAAIRVQLGQKNGGPRPFARVASSHEVG